MDGTDGTDRTDGTDGVDGMVRLEDGKKCALDLAKRSMIDDRDFQPCP